MKHHCDNCDHEKAEYGSQLRVIGWLEAFLLFDIGVILGASGTASWQLMIGIGEVWVLEWIFYSGVIIGLVVMLGVWATMALRREVEKDRDGDIQGSGVTK